MKSKVQNFADEKKREEIIKELKSAIIDGGIKITDLFSADDIVSSDPALKSRQQEYEHAKRVEKKLGEEREKVITLTEEKEKADKKLGELNEQLSFTKVKSLFDTSAEARKLDEKQKTFIQKRIDVFKFAKEGDEFKTEFEKFIDKQLIEFADTAKLFGVPVDKSKTPGAGPGDGKDINTEADLENPEKNPFIPKE
jgi:hypothetical protein